MPIFTLYDFDPSGVFMSRVQISRRTVKAKAIENKLSLESLLNFHFWLLLAVVGFMLLGSVAQAGQRRYQADIDESQWDYSGNALHCELSQEIPFYGKATFSSEAGRPNLDFQLVVSRNQPQEFVQASLRSEAPTWRPRENQKFIDNIELLPAKSIVDFSHDRAWRMLSELEQGFHPALYYSDWIDSHDVVKVALSSVRFQPTYKDFIGCMGALLPYSFDDIKYSVLNFEFNSASFKPSSQQQLSKLKKYLKADQEMQVILVAGHTDSQGKRGYNQSLSRRRAQTVKNYLIGAGIKSSQIRINSYGESRPVASNANPIGRAKNRRVVVRLVK